MPIKKIDISWSPKKLSSIMKSNDDWVLSVDENLSSANLREIYGKHINSPYCSDIIIESIAEHPNTPVDILEVLSQKEDWRILDALATNPSINQRIIDNILKSDNYTVLEHLVYNPSFTRKGMIELL